MNCKVAANDHPVQLNLLSNQVSTHTLKKMKTCLDNALFIEHYIQGKSPLAANPNLRNDSLG